MSKKGEFLSFSRQEFRRLGSAPGSFLFDLHRLTSRCEGFLSTDTRSEVANREANPVENLYIYIIRSMRTMNFALLAICCESDGKGEREQL